MQASLNRFTPEQLIGIGTTATALALLAASWAGESSLMTTYGLPLALLAGSLVISLILSYRFPIHIRHSTKIYMASVPAYLMAALLPVPLAAAAAGLGVLGGELMAAPKKGSYPSEIATHASRFVVVAYAASLVAHAQVPDHRFFAAPLIAAAMVFYAGDVLTLPLALAPISGEHPLRIVVASVREGVLGEGAQYLVGLLGVLAATQQIWGLALLALPTILVYLAFKSVKEMREGTRKILENMADTVDMRDPYTGGHSRHVAELVGGILQELRMRGPEAKLVVSAARVHDIGKIGIPDHILRKDGMLSSEEWRIMESHAERGAELLGRYPDFVRGVEIVRHHHERWDGEGYPYRLKGAEIPFGARVIAVADSFDAMTSDRPYRRALSATQAATILRDGRGRQWDPALVDAFLRSIAHQIEQEKARGGEAGKRGTGAPALHTRPTHPPYAPELLRLVPPLADPAPGIPADLARAAETG
jgi:hypothetical protein